MSSPTVKQLLEENIFDLLGVESASDETKSRLLDALTRLVEAKIVDRLMAEMSEEDAQAFGQIAETGDSQQLVDFLSNKEIDLLKLVTEEAVRARVELVELTNLATTK